MAALKRWKNNPGRPDCPQCRDLEGATQPIGKEFSPGVASPPLHPNCDCTLEFIHQIDP